MHASTTWVLFSLDAGRYALPLATVERIVPAAQITPLPGAPDVVLGAVDVGGHVLPVFNLRRRFGLRERALGIADHFLIARTPERAVILLIDAPQGVVDGTFDTIVEAARVSAGLAHIRGILVRDDGLVLIHDLEQLLSAAEAAQLDEALDQAHDGAPERETRRAG